MEDRLTAAGCEGRKMEGQWTRSGYGQKRGTWGILWFWKRAKKGFQWGKSSINDARRLDSHIQG